VKKRVEERAMHVAMPQKVQQEGKPIYPIREKVQEIERMLRRTEEEAACVAKLQDVQQGWRKSSVEELKKRVEEYCGKGIPEEV